MFLGPSPIWYAVCDTARHACVDVHDQDPAPMAMRAATPTMEGDLGPIGGPCRGAVAPAFGGMGDLAHVASIGVYRENGVAANGVSREDDQTVGGSSASEAPRALLVVLQGHGRTVRRTFWDGFQRVLLASPTLSRLFTSTGGQ